jgi:hypothetical protein
MVSWRSCRPSSTTWVAVVQSAQQPRLLLLAERAPELAGPVRTALRLAAKTYARMVIAVMGGSGLAILEKTTADA